MVYRRGNWAGRPLSPSLPVTAPLITPVGVAVATALRLPRQTPRQLTTSPALNHLHQMVPYARPYKLIRAGVGRGGQIVNLSQCRIELHWTV